VPQQTSTTSSSTWTDTSSQPDHFTELGAPPRDLVATLPTSSSCHYFNLLF
jgi:hypothetical protein